MAVIIVIAVCADMAVRYLIKEDLITLEGISYHCVTKLIALVEITHSIELAAIVLYNAYVRCRKLVRMHGTLRSDDEAPTRSACQGPSNRRWWAAVEVARVDDGNQGLDRASA